MCYCQPKCMYKSWALSLCALTIAITIAFGSLDVDIDTSVVMKKRELAEQYVIDTEYCALVLTAHIHTRSILRSKALTEQWMHITGITESQSANNEIDAAFCYSNYLRLFCQRVAQAIAPAIRYQYSILANTVQYYNIVLYFAILCQYYSQQLLLYI